MRSVGSARYSDDNDGGDGGMMAVRGQWLDDNTVIRPL
jgi:hypothetical protein